MTPSQTLANRGRPLPVAVRAWVETIGWGAIAGAGSGLAVMAVVGASSIAGGGSAGPAEAAGVLFIGAQLALTWGGLLGAGYGIIAGFPMAVAMTALSALWRPEYAVSLRLLGAVAAFLAVSTVGAGFLLGLERGWWPNSGADTWGPSSLPFWFAALAFAPGVIAAVIFAWRTPSVVHPRTPATPPLLAAPEWRTAAVAELPQ